MARERRKSTYQVVRSNLVLSTPILVQIDRLRMIQEHASPNYLFVMKLNIYQYDFYWLSIHHQKAVIF
jgi:hypothetical protein